MVSPCSRDVRRNLRAWVEGKADFERLPFEFPPAWKQQGAARLRQELRVQHGIDVPESLSIPLKDCHQKRLAEARELFTSPIIALRTQ